MKDNVQINSYQTLLKKKMKGQKYFKFLYDWQFFKYSHYKIFINQQQGWFFFVSLCYTYVFNCYTTVYIMGPN